MDLIVTKLLLFFLLPLSFLIDSFDSFHICFFLFLQGDFLLTLVDTIITFQEFGFYLENRFNFLILFCLTYFVINMCFIFKKLFSFFLLRLFELNITLSLFKDCKCLNFHCSLKFINPFSLVMNCIV